MDFPSEIIGGKETDKNNKANENKDTNTPKIKTELVLEIRLQIFPQEIIPEIKNPDQQKYRQRQR